METTYPKDTLEEVKKVLNHAIEERLRIRVWYGKNGRSWNEENDIIGYIGSSTGTNKVPLLIHSARSFGGGALLVHCIIKIMDVKTKKVLYQHPKFKQAYFEADDTLVYQNISGKRDPSTAEIYANCKTPEKAVRLASFMNGTRMAK